MTAEALPDELPGGQTYAEVWSEAERIGDRSWRTATDEERIRIVTGAAVSRRRQQEQAERFGYASIADYLAAIDDPDAPIPLARFLTLELDPPEWIVADLIPKGPAVGALVGAEKAGKSLAGLQLCMAVAMGFEFLGFDTENPGPTLFVEYEGSKAALQKRAGTIAAKYGALADPPAVSIVHRPGVKIDTDAGQEWLTRHCAGRVLCVIGPVSKAATIQKEADQFEWARLTQRLQAVSDETRCTILLVHHLRKPDRTMGAPSRVSDFMNAVRGSNALMGAVDVAVGVQRDPESTEGVLYSMQREAAGGRTPYTFDIPSLCIYPDGRPLRKPARADRLDALRDYLGDHPGSSKADMMGALGYSEDALDGYLKTLAPELDVPDVLPGQAKRYSIR